MDAALRQKLDDLPVSPGVYLMKDRRGEVIYVGKAKNLRSRVRSYFQPGRTDERAFIPLLDELLGDLEVILVHTEKEALILENTLIKRHKPRFNVMLRDDKTFISLRLDERHPYPRLEVVRRHPNDGARYFGPYSSASAIRETLRIANRYFGLRTCTDQVFERRKRPCLLYQIGRCPAPCVYEVPEEEYRRSVRELVLFLEGKEPELVERLRGRMRAAAAELRFEEAARLRDQIAAVEKSLEKQRTVMVEPIDQDVFGFHREGPDLEIELLLVRAGRMVSARSFGFVGQEFPTEELLASALLQYYAAAVVPDEILLPLEIEEAETLAELLAEQRGRKVRLHVPVRGDRRRLVEMANKNAAQSFLDRKRRNRSTEEILARLQRRLELSRLPRRIECYDISNFQGQTVVGSQVTFVDGEPERSLYRHYKIKGFTGQDDFAALYEVLTRRLKRGLEGNDLPDLLLIDGGKGQLNSARAAVKDLGLLDRVDLASLAKSRVEGVTEEGGVTRSQERVFLPGRKDPLVLRQNSAELFLLERLRDEAHRFAITFHQKLRTARNFRSVLQEIPGIGDKRRRALLRHFGSLKRIRAATAEEIARVDGFHAELAQRVVEYLAAPEGGSGAEVRAESEAGEEALAQASLPDGVAEALEEIGVDEVETALGEAERAADPVLSRASDRVSTGGEK
jgi:excinuclease ABC subunit C